MVPIHGHNNSRIATEAAVTSVRAEKTQSGERTQWRLAYTRNQKLRTLTVLVNGNLQCRAWTADIAVASTISVPCAHDAHKLVSRRGVDDSTGKNLACNGTTHVLVIVRG